MRLLENIHNYDVATFGKVLRIKNRDLFVKLSRSISFTADGPLYAIIGVIFLYQAKWHYAALIALAFVIERILYKTFKTTFRRNRPPEAIPGYKSEVIPSDQFSFPSGHTSAAFMMAGILTFIFPWAAWFLYPWACSVGIARVMLGVHFPSDILAGALMGSAVCSLAISLLF